MFHQTYIAGVKFRMGAADILAALDDGSEVILEPEPTNQYDPHAVRVMSGNRHVGFVPRDLSQEVSGLIAAGQITRAVKRSGNSLEIHYEKGNCQ